MSKTLNAEVRDSTRWHKLPLQPGRTVNINHEGCPAGEDTRRRLYLTRQRVPTDVVLWYCHNCGNGGAFKSRMNAAVEVCADPIPERRESIGDIWRQSIPYTSHEMWPDHAKEYILQRNVPGSFICNCMRYHPIRDALCTMVHKRFNYRNVDQPLGLVLRNFGHGSPKYITYKEDKTQPMRTYFGTAGDRTTYVTITEDVLSASRAYFSSYEVHSYALYGTHCTVDDLLYLRDKCDQRNVLVWLDNDNDTVRDHATQIAARASLLGMNVAIERERYDPKYATNANIFKRTWSEVIEECTKQL